jgi:hypothetical protein
MSNLSQIVKSYPFPNLTQTIFFNIPQHAGTLNVMAAHGDVTVPQHHQVTVWAKAKTIPLNGMQSTYTTTFKNFPVPSYYVLGGFRVNANFNILW